MEAFAFADFSPKSGQTLQHQLHQHLVNKINRGQLPPGTRLPSSRRIATELNISRNTVTEVMEQLKSEGFVRSYPGNGVFIDQALPKDSRALQTASWDKLSDLPTLSEFGLSLNHSPLKARSASLPFTLGIPDLSAFPNKVWLRIQRRHQDRSHLRGFDCDQGYQPLRDALAHYLKISRGVRCDAEQIIITQGAQQAITLCTQVLLNEGDQVLMENPGYSRARCAFTARGVNMQCLPVGRHGLNVNDLPEQTNTKLMYTTPTHQYPLGGILSAAQRLQLLDWASKRKHWIIEDDYDSEFHFYAKPIAALQGMAEQTPVLYVGSFSKTLFPALRLGYLIVPKPLVSTFVRAKAYQSGETPLLFQATVADFINEGHFVRHLRRMSQLYQQKWEHMEILVKQELTGLATSIAESAGMHLVLKTEKLDDKKLEQEFLTAGFGSTALSRYYHKTQTPDSHIMHGLALGFSNTTKQNREQGVRELRRILENLL